MRSSAVVVSSSRGSSPAPLVALVAAVAWASVACAPGVAPPLSSGHDVRGGARIDGDGAAGVVSGGAVGDDDVGDDGVGGHDGVGGDDGAGANDGDGACDDGGDACASGDDGVAFDDGGTAGDDDDGGSAGDDDGGTAGGDGGTAGDDDGGTTGDDDGGDVADDDAGAADVDGDAGAVDTSAGRIVHWQHNSDWPEAGNGTYFDSTHLFRRALEYAQPPDLFAIQECGKACACGGASNYDATTASCIDPPPSDTYAARMNAVLGDDFDVAVSAWANSVFWRKDRFARVDAFQWNATDADPTYASCAAPSDPNGNEQMNVAVLLNDTRGTAGVDDDRRVVLASMHVGNVPACTTKLVKHFDETVAARWGAPSFVFLSGDWNAAVDTTSATAAARRAEMSPSCWYAQLARGVDAPSSCGADYAGYWDVVRATHPGDEICSQYTFTNPASGRTANDLQCDSDRALSRIDYTWLGGTSATAASIRKADVDQGFFDDDGDGSVEAGEIYSGHRAIRTVVRYQ